MKKNRNRKRDARRRRQRREEIRKHRPKEKGRTGASPAFIARQTDKAIESLNRNEEAIDRAIQELDADG